MITPVKNKKTTYHPIIWINYFPRLVGNFFNLGMTGTVLYSQGNRLWAPYLLLFFQGVIWPHLALLFSTISKNPKPLEFNFLLIDSAYAGIWIPYMNFAVLPCITMFCCLTMANFSMGGMKLAAKCILAMIVVAIPTLIFHGISFQPITHIIPSIIALSGLIVFTATMGYLTYIRARTLKETKHRLRIAYNDLENLNRVLKSASSSLELDNVMQQIASSFNAFFTFDVITLQITEESHNELRFKAISGFGMADKISDLALLHPKLNYANCLSVKAYIDNTVVYIPEVSSHMELSYIDKNIHEITGFNSLIYIPLVVQNNIMGVIGFLSKKRMVITEKTMNTIRLQLSHISLILKNAVLYDELKRPYA